MSFSLFDLFPHGVKTFTFTIECGQCGAVEQYTAYDNDVEAFGKVFFESGWRMHLDKPICPTCIVDINNRRPDYMVNPVDKNRDDLFERAVMLGKRQENK